MQQSAECKCNKQIYYSAEEACKVARYVERRYGGGKPLSLRCNRRLAFKLNAEEGESEVSWQQFAMGQLVWNIVICALLLVHMLKDRSRNAR